MKGKQLQFYKVISSKGAESADILLYGYIGQDLWWDDDLKEQSITDIEFAKVLRDLEKDYSRINIRINSLGGSMLHGNAIINFMRSSSSEIHTYIDGIAASMAADIWFASPNRHMANNSMLMVHNAITGYYGNAKGFREVADLMDKYTSTTIAVMAEALGKTDEQIHEEYYKDYDDKWFTAKEALAAGFIDKIEDYKVEMPIAEPQKMNHSQLIKAFRKVNDQPQPSMFSKVWKALGFDSINPSKNKIPMNKEELLKALEDGEITIQEVADVVGESADYQVEKTQPTPKKEKPDVSALITAAVEKALAPIQTKIEKLDADFKKFGDQPGASPAAVQIDADDVVLSDAEKAYQADIEAMIQAAESGVNPYRG